MEIRRIGLLGPSRSRQGLGPHLARFAEADGAFVAACVGSSIDSSQRGALELQTLLGHEVQAYADLDSMIEGEASRGAPLDALIIASPHATHEAALRSAAAAGLHTLCEKPLIWGGEDLVERTQAILDSFMEAGLCLQVNAQWPYTLPAYYRLFPHLARGHVDRFHCLFSPISRGAAQIPDALPHPLSLLQAISPSGEPELGDLEIDCGDETKGRQTFSFIWPGDAGPVSCEILLQTQENPPRSAMYGVQGHSAHRHIRMPGYELSFRGALAQVLDSGGPESAEVVFEDPMGALVRDFLSFAGNGRTRKADDAPLQRTRILKQIQDAHDKLSRT